MTVEQVYSLVNNITSEITGQENILAEDLSNVVDVGKAVFGATDVDNYVKTLVDRIGRTVFVNRPYYGKLPSIMRTAWEFGSVMMKISADIPQATENETWELVDQQSYDPNVFYKPTVSAKFYNSKTTFEIPLSFTERQVKESFNSATELNAFISMLFNSVEKSMTIKIDGLIMRTINNMTANIINGSNGVQKVNLLANYNTLNGTTLTAAKALYDKEFIRYATMQIGLYADRITTMSSLFNAGGKDRFTPTEDLRIVLLSEFSEASKVYLLSEARHNEFVTLPKYETVPYWQGSGKNFNFADNSQINVKINGGATVQQGGIIGVMFDRDALGVANLDRRVTTNYNPKAEFFTNWYKFDAGFFNDLNENFVVFYIEDTETDDEGGDEGGDDTPTD